MNWRRSEQRTTRKSFPSQHPHLPQARVPAPRHDHVVVQLDPHQLARALHAARELQVLGGRLEGARPLLCLFVVGTTERKSPVRPPLPSPGPSGNTSGGVGSSWASPSGDRRPRSASTPRPTPPGSATTTFRSPGSGRRSPASSAMTCSRRLRSSSGSDGPITSRPSPRLFPSVCGSTGPAWGSAGNSWLRSSGFVPTLSGTGRACGQPRRRGSSRVCSASLDLSRGREPVTSRRALSGRPSWLRELVFFFDPAGTTAPLVSR